MNVYSRGYVDSLFEQFQKDPSQIDPEWREYFEQYATPLNASDGNGNGTPARLIPAASGVAGSHRGLDNVAHLQDRVDQLLRGYRVRGHLSAKVDPLGNLRDDNRELAPESYGLLPSDMDKPFSTCTIDGTNVRTLGEIVEQLRETYCRYIGAQFMHIDDHEVRDWLQQRMEGTKNRLKLSRDMQFKILTWLTDAVIFEEFMRRRFVGSKTFSLEGAESVIPLLGLALEKAGEHGVTDVVIGMAHRGRLNVLANVMGKRSENIFWSFDDPKPHENIGRGDVPYHLGYSNDWTTTTNKKIHLSLCFNPSHLEYVNPVALGRVRAKQDRRNDVRRDEVLALLIHGDAAFAGEGIVQETLNMSELAGYTVGGTLHVIINNQIGFTTTSEDSRSSTYASDVAKMLQIPIFHVNGEDPEAVAQVVHLAMEFRREFKRDVVIDVYCYRRLGHNESDEPRFTQPVMYRAIETRPSVRESYLKHLLRYHDMSRDEADQVERYRKETLEREFDSAKKSEYVSDMQTLGGLWEDFFGGDEPRADTITGVPREELEQLMTVMTEVPKEFNLNPKLKRMMSQRKEMAMGQRDVDWATAELTAFATLLAKGHRVRLSGQDSGRGTFSQRHAILHDAETGSAHCPLHYISGEQAPLEIINSPLSESGVLGFEYGYSLDTPDGLVLWEAQFGDFWNVAQVIVDQFIASAEDKWKRLSGLVMLLPHGFEGAGPEHCSARLERILVLAAEDNIQVAYPTSAAQYFHLLRRQVIRKWRKPLLVMTPKSLLREPAVASPLKHFETGCFQKVIVDSFSEEIDRPRRVLLATGKLAVELLKIRDQESHKDVAVVSLEQLYPLPNDELLEALETYPEGTEVVWCQEEPENMGALQYIKVNFGDSIFGRWPLRTVSRPPSASPSTGSKKAHKIEQQRVWDKAFQE